jgi:hypothetical protein
MAGLVVLAVIGAAAMLSGGVSNAAPPVGTRGSLMLAPTATPTPATLTADPPSPLGQTGPTKVTLTMRAPGIYAGGTWLLTDNGKLLVSSSVAQGNDEFRWEWTPPSFGLYHLVATFQPDCAQDQYCPPGATAALTYEVIEAIPTPVSVALTLTVTPASPVPAGTTETLTATVSPPLGSVQFYDGDTLINNPTAGGTDGVVSTTTTLAPGTHTLTAADTPPQPPFAIPGGSFTFRSPAVTYVVNAPTPTPSPTPIPTPSPGPTPAAGIPSTTTTLQVAPNPGYSFIPEIFIARVSPFNAVGTVQFWDGNTNVRTNLGDAVPVTGGIALKFATLPKGNHTLTAVFNPANIGGCLGTAGFPGMPTPRPCPNSNVPAFLSSVSSPVSLTVHSLFGGLGF